MAESDFNSNVYDRIGKIEAEQASISTSIDQLSSSIKEIAGKINEMQNNTRTDWGILAGWATVILAIVGMMGAGFIHQPMAQMEKIQSKLAEDFAAHVSIDGHGVMIERTKNLEGRIVDLDTVLQREMRLLDNKIDAHIEAINERMTATNSIVEGQLLETRDAIAELRERVKGNEVLLMETSIDVDDISQEQRRRSTAGRWQE